jgi:hypothetical protein
VGVLSPQVFADDSLARNSEPRGFWIVEGPVSDAPIWLRPGVARDRPCGSYIRAETLDVKGKGGTKIDGLTARRTGVRRVVRLTAKQHRLAAVLV